MSPGMAYGELGPTHHSIEDIAWIRAIGDLPVYVPADADETRAVMRSVLASNKPAFMRVGRHKVPAVSAPNAAFTPGIASVLREGGDLSFIAIGTMVSRALEAAERLAAQGISARVINAASVKPLDDAAVLEAARETGRIVTAEEGITRGGLGSAVAELVVQHHPVPMRILGIPDFAPTGSTEYLLEYFGLDAAGLERAALQLLGR
jgi:transketolase